MTEDEYRLEIGLRIANARKEKGLSQEKFAEKIGVSKSALGMYEQGRRKPGNVEITAIARETGKAAAYLMCLDDVQGAAASWLNPAIERLPDAFKEGLRVAVDRYIEVAAKMPESVKAFLAAPTSENYPKWERMIQDGYRQYIEGRPPLPSLNSQAVAENGGRESPDLRNEILTIFDQATAEQKKLILVAAKNAIKPVRV